MNEQPQAAKEGQPGGRKRPAPRAPGQTISCGWCGHTVPVPARGRVPKWCSPTCRHRAWEQSRAAASGLVAVQVKDRVVETVKTVSVVQHHRVEVPTAYRPYAAQDFATVLADLTRMLDEGRLYDRDLPTLAPAVAELARAFQRRHKTANRPLW